MEAKPKRILTQEQREHLDRIRVLAAEKKRAMKEQAHKAKNLKNEEIEFKAKQYDDLQKQKQENEVKKQPLPKKKVVKKIIEVVDDDDEEEEEEEEEVVKRIVRRTKPKETINQLAYQTSQEKLMHKVLEHRMNNAVSAMTNSLAMQYY